MQESVVIHAKFFTMHLLKCYSFIIACIKKEYGLSIKGQLNISLLLFLKRNVAIHIWPAVDKSLGIFFQYPTCQRVGVKAKDDSPIIVKQLKSQNIIAVYVNTVLNLVLNSYFKK